MLNGLFSRREREKIDLKWHYHLIRMVIRGKQNMYLNLDFRELQGKPLKLIRTYTYTRYELEEYN